MMRITLKLILTILFFSNNCFSQSITNGDFEFWENPLPSVNRPWNWSTADSLIVALGTNIKTVHKTTDAYSGQYAVKITPLQSPNPIVYRNAVLVLGTKSYIDTSNFYVYPYMSGDSVSCSVFSVDGYYKFVPDTQYNERALIRVATTTDTYIDWFTDGVTAAGDSSLPATDTFRQFHILMDKRVGIQTMDSINIEIRYQSKNTSASPSGYLIIDKLSITPNLITYLNAYNENEETLLELFPNPVQNILNIKYNHNKKGLFRLFNNLGQMVFESVLVSDNKPLKISTSNFSNGLYTYTVSYSDLKTVNGKLLISR
jgi:hypothetical protein